MINIQLTENQARLFLLVLEDLGDKYGNAGCNDLPQEWKKILSKKEWKEFKKLNPDEDDDGYMADFQVVETFENLIKNALKTK